MKGFTVNTKEFLKELEWVTRFVESKTTIPILANVMLAPVEGGIALTGTDLEIGAIGFVEGKGKITPITFPCRTAIKYLKRVDEPEIQLSTPTGENVLVIGHGEESEAKFNGMATESFPELPKPKRNGFELGGLLAALPRTIISISTEESRFTLNGALLEIADGKAAIVSTDGHRIGKHDLVVAAKSAKVKALIPRSALTQLAHLKLDTVLFAGDENHVFFDFEKRRILSRRLTGTFPEYEKVFPKAFDYAVTFDNEAASKALKRVALMADERAQCIRWTINSKLTLSAEVADQGEAKAAIPVNFIRQPKAEWHSGFKAPYILEALAVMPEVAEFRFSEPYPAGHVKEGQPTAVELGTEGWRYVVMPMRI